MPSQVWIKTFIREKKSLFLKQYLTFTMKFYIQFQKAIFFCVFVYGDQLMK